MKSIYLLVVTGLMHICMSSCSSSETDDSLVISIMEDVTEKDYKTRPHSQTIINDLHLTDNPWRSVTFRYTTVSELDYNRQEEVSLIQENRLVGNSYLRKKKIKEYTSDISSIIEQTRTPVEQSQSAIFLPIIRELRQLAQMSANTKELYVFSDLKENDSEWFSFYRSSNLQSLKNYPDEVVELFLAQIPEGASFDNVSLHIIYEPLNADDNQEFRLMVKLYQNIFDSLNVPLSFSANM